ncbi:MAG: hypothetical protein JSR39_11115 [Verrucomicrobia bacterium]|nr:hypothetical protein [Verrucomicrobiota bacterium]
MSKYIYSNGKRYKTYHHIKEEIFEHVDMMINCHRKRRLLFLRFYLLGKDLNPVKVKYDQLRKDSHTSNSPIKLFLDQFKYFFTVIDAHGKFLVFQCKKEFVETMDLMLEKEFDYGDIFREKIISVKGQQKWLKGIELVDLKVEQE